LLFNDIPFLSFQLLIRVELGLGLGIFYSSS
jgi:hypothetical protein